MRRLLATGALGAVVLAGCSESFKPASLVDKLRVLAIAAQPPDIGPGEAAVLEALVVDPRDRARPNAQVWLACDPDPTGLGESPCTQFDTLEDPSSLAQGGDLPPGVRILGAGPTALYRPPADLFGALAPDDPRRLKGALALVLLVAAAAPLPADEPGRQELMRQIRDKEVESVLAVKRIRVSEDSARNESPAIEGLVLGGKNWGRDARPRLAPGEGHLLVGLAAPGSRERFVAVEPDGRRVEREENLVFSWFATAGALEVARSLEGEEVERLSFSRDAAALPDDRRVALWAVLRDGRGGADWIEASVFVCDPGLDADPRLASIDPPSGPPGTVVALRGEHLDDALDVQIGEESFADAIYDADVGEIRVAIDPLAPIGVLRVAVRSRGCGPDSQVFFEVVVPR